MSDRYQQTKSLSLGNRYFYRESLDFSLWSYTILQLSTKRGLKKEQCLVTRKKAGSKLLKSRLASRCGSIPQQISTQRWTQSSFRETGLIPSRNFSASGILTLKHDEAPAKWRGLLLFISYIQKNSEGNLSEFLHLCRNGEASGARTQDLILKRDLLYQLS